MKLLNVASVSIRRLFFRFATACLLTMAAAGWTSSALAQVTSTFDTSTEGWSVADLYEQPSGSTPGVAGNYSVSYSSTGGNPGGYIYEADPSPNSYYFQAPTKFLGNQSVSVGGRFSFDVADGPATTLNSGESSLILVGANESIYFPESSAANPAFTSLSFTLAPGSGGMVNGQGGASATLADFNSVLGNLKAVYILGDYYNGNDTGKLDNVVLTSTGAASAWGDNSSGQLGNGTTNDSSVPVAVSGLSRGVTAIAAGSGHSLAIQNGAAVAWGDNNYGQLGNGGTPPSSSTPVQVSGLASGVTAIAAGGLHSLAIQNGAAMAWGDNGAGQLGNGTNTNSSTPVQVSGLTSGVTAIAAATDGSNSLAIQNGAAMAWGYGGNGEMGNGTRTGSNTPVQVSGLSSGVTAIAAGSLHCLAIQNGAAYAWGFNNQGQLGNGTTAQSNVPVAVLNLSTGVTAIAGGDDHSLAVQNGNVFAWGGNSHGQLGNGTTISSATPVEIDAAQLTNITAVAAGKYNSYALSGDGSLWVWGDNDHGQLGLGTTTDYDTPQHLLPPSGYYYSAIDASNDFADAILTPVAVPEPTTWLGGALLLAPAGLALHRRWHRVIGNRPAA